MTSSIRGRVPVLLVLATMLSGCAPRDGGASIERLDGSSLRIADLERFVAGVMDKAGVPGLSCAIINDAHVAYRKGFGLRSAKTGEPNDPETIFAAASFSKTVFAYLTMLLAEQGVIDLDRPLQEYLSRPLAELPRYADLAGDERTGRITARMVLSHTTGFPNWRWLTDDKKLVFLFEPGARFSYSGEGIVLLQHVIEQITGRGLDDLSREMIFEPLDMRRTSYVWEEAFEYNHAVPHDEFQRARRLNRRREADAAGSMQTTAGDYARFLCGLLNATGPREAMVEAMLAPQVSIHSEGMFGPGSRRDTKANEPMRLSWALGWGRFELEQGWAFFHTGHDSGWQNYTVTFPERGIGIVMMSNSDNFESVAREIAAFAIGDEYSPFDWLGYEPFDPSRRREPPPEPVAITVAPEILAGYAGEYLFSGNQTIVIKLEAGRLFISKDHETWDELLAEQQNLFFVEADETRFSFVRDASGRATELRIHIEGLDFPAPRVR